MPSEKQSLSSRSHIKPQRLYKVDRSHLPAAEPQNPARLEILAEVSGSSTLTTNRHDPKSVTGSFMTVYKGTYILILMKLSIVQGLGSGPNDLLNAYGTM